MALIELPVAADTPHQSFSITLDGAIYTVRLRYNSRAAHWAFDLFDAAGTPLVAGMAIRLGVDLLAQFSDDAFPPGRLFAINWSSSFVEASRDNFGTDVSLVYEEAS